LAEASSTVDRLRAEARGPGYARHMMVETRNRTFAAIQRIGSLILPGMTEEEGIAVGRRMLREDGLLRGWHGINVRFGVNTVHTFNAKSEPCIVLGEDDIFFIDIGPVWRRDRLTGTALYEAAALESECRGWLLNREMTGHRVSDFPHAAHYDGALADAPFVPSPALWILEIQLRHPTRPFGAFYEDLLPDAADA